MQIEPVHMQHVCQRACKHVSLCLISIFPALHVPSGTGKQMSVKRVCFYFTTSTAPKTLTQGCQGNLAVNVKMIIQEIHYRDTQIPQKVNSKMCWRKSLLKKSILEGKESIQQPRTLMTLILMNTHNMGNEAK